jgi:hypothetical protein
MFPENVRKKCLPLCKLPTLILPAAVLVSLNAFAQGLTRDEVRQHLVESQQNGSQLVTDGSYPAVGTFYENQAVKLPQQNTTAHRGAYASSKVSGTHAKSVGQQACVGPVNFCNIYGKH